VYGLDPRESDLTPASPALVHDVLGAELLDEGAFVAARLRSGRRDGSGLLLMLALLSALVELAGRDAHPLMPLDFVIDRFGLPSRDARARGRPARAGARQGIAGLPGSSPAVLLAALARRLAQRVFCGDHTHPDRRGAVARGSRTLTVARSHCTRTRGGSAERADFEIAGRARGDARAAVSGQVRVLVTTAAPPLSGQGFRRRSATSIGAGNG